jgi:hypothetical protein
MSSPDEIPKPCVTPPDSPVPFRIGSVKYLNAVPLTRGIEGEIIFTTPAQLAQMLRRDELDAALVSITEVLLNDRYDILDGVAIASLGEVHSVLLAHKKPLEEAKEIYFRNSYRWKITRPRRKRILSCSSATRRLISSARGTRMRFSTSVLHGRK